MIRLTQCLCPSRHAIMAVFYDTDAPGPALRDVVTLMIAEDLINPWCGICHSREFHYEDAATAFGSMEEATAAAKVLEEANMRSGKFLQSGRN